MFEEDDEYTADGYCSFGCACAGAAREQGRPEDA